MSPCSTKATPMLLAHGWLVSEMVIGCSQAWGALLTFKSRTSWPTPRPQEILLSQ